MVKVPIHWLHSRSSEGIVIQEQQNLY